MSEHDHSNRSKTMGYTLSDRPCGTYGCGSVTAYHCRLKDCGFWYRVCRCGWSDDEGDDWFEAGDLELDEEDTDE